ncbi:MAG: lysylphosphatidylglycerol synthase domain-containing protein [Anaerolineae bacterium]
MTNLGLRRHLGHFLASLARLRLPRWIRSTLGIVILLASTVYLTRLVLPWFELGYWRSLHIDAWRLGLVVSVFTLGIYVGGVGWHTLLKSVGGHLPLGECMRIHATANLAKYLPGSGWQVVGKTYLAHHGGMPLGVATASTLLEAALTLMTGCGVATMGDLGALLGTSLSGEASAALRILAIITPLGFPLVYNRLRDLVQPASRMPSLHTGWFLLGYLLYTLVWIVYGLGFSLFVDMLWPVETQDLLRVVLASTLATLGGLVALFAPAGIGVREVLLAKLLGGLVTGPLGSVISVLSRPLYVMGELLAWALITIGKRLLDPDKRRTVRLPSLRQNVS